MCLFNLQSVYLQQKVYILLLTFCHLVGCFIFQLPKPKNKLFYSVIKREKLKENTFEKLKSEK